MECYRCAANQVLTYLSLIFSSRNAVRWCWVVSTKKQIVSPSLPSQNVDGCSPLSNEGEEARGEKKHEKFQSFYCALRFNFLCFTSRSPLYFFNNAGTCTLNQGSSVHFSRNRKWKVFHSERGFRSDTSLLLLDSNVQNTMFEKNETQNTFRVHDREIH